MMRKRLRRLRLGLETVTGLKKSGFFIPYRYADQVPGPAARKPYAALKPLFAAAEPDFRALIRAMKAHGDDLRRIGGDAPPQPRWNQV